MRSLMVSETMEPGVTILSPTTAIKGCVSRSTRPREVSERTLELGVNELGHGPVLRNLERLLLVALRPADEELLDCARVELAELSDRLDADLASSLDDFVVDVGKLEEGRGTGVDGLEDELLEVEDGDVRRKPVVGEGDRGEAGGERKRESDSSELLCKAREESVPPSRDEEAERDAPRRRAASLMGTRSM